MGSPQGSLAPKALKLWGRAAHLGLPVPSCSLHHVRSCTVAAEPLGEAHACGGLQNWVSAPQVFASSLQSLRAWALGLQAAGSVPARQAVAMACCFLILFPARPLVTEGFSQRIWGVVRGPRGKPVTVTHGCGIISLDRETKSMANGSAEQPLAYHQLFSFGTELGPRAADTELPEAADLNHQY